MASKVASGPTRLASFLLGSVLLHASTVIAVRTPSLIVFGADAKLVHGDGSPAGFGCKIWDTNHVVYGYARLVSSPAFGFDVKAIVDPILQKAGTLADRVSSFEGIVIPKLRAIWESERTNDPPGFDKFRDKSVLDVVFASFEGHIPKMMLRYFMCRVATDGAIEIKPEGQNWPELSDIGCAGIGTYDAAFADIDAHRSIWKLLGLENAVRHLIEDETLDKPEAVGGSITLVRITDAGPVWLSHGECPQTTKPSPTPRAAQKNNSKKQ